MTYIERRNADENNSIKMSITHFFRYVDFYSETIKNQILEMEFYSISHHETTDKNDKENSTLIFTHYLSRKLDYQAKLYFSI